MDHSVRIAEINAILVSGVTTMTVDGVTTVYDHDSLRKERTQLMAEDPNYASRKPRIATVRFNGY